MAATHPRSNAFFDTRSLRIAARRNSSFVKNFGWLFCMNGKSQSRHCCHCSVNVSEGSWLLVFVIVYDTVSARPNIAGGTRSEPVADFYINRSTFSSMRT